MYSCIRMHVDSNLIYISHTIIQRRSSAICLTIALIDISVVPAASWQRINWCYSDNLNWSHHRINKCGKAWSCRMILSNSHSWTLYCWRSSIWGLRLLTACVVSPVNWLVEGNNQMTRFLLLSAVKIRTQWLCSKLVLKAIYVFLSIFQQLYSLFKLLRCFIDCKDITFVSSLLFHRCDKIGCRLFRWRKNATGANHGYKQSINCTFSIFMSVLVCLTPAHCCIPKVKYTRRATGQKRFFILPCDHDVSNDLK